MFDGLLRSGWKETKPLRKNVARTLVYEQQGDDGLVLEERDDALWIWIEGAGDRRVIGVSPTNESELRRVLDAIDAMRDALTVSSYLTHYGTLSGICSTSIIAWEQFDTSPPNSEPGPTRPVDMAEVLKAAGELATGGDPDPLVFPNERMARLSDYVAFLKRMQGGDMQGALAAFGLDMMSMSGVMTKWGQKLASDPVLTQKFAKLMAG